MQKTTNIKYQLYKASFALVLCVFFFVQTQAAFIACAYNDYALNTQGASFQKTLTGQLSFKAKSGAESQPKYKLNKRYQPVTSPAILPYIFYLEPRISADINEWATVSFAIVSSFSRNIHPRGPPVFWSNC